MPEEINYYGLVNKPPLDEICNIDLVNKPDIMSDELLHFGIKGMKWGVRRYQNPDGSLTEAGKKRAKKEEKRKEKEHRKIMTDRKKYLNNYYDLSEKDRKMADKYFEALERMEKREITHINKIDKQRKSRIDSLLTVPTLAKGAAVTAGALVGLTISHGKLLEWLRSPNGKSVRKALKRFYGLDSRYT